MHVVFCFVAVVLTFSNIVVGQVPRPCVSPPQWEARIFSYNEGQNFLVTARLTYDSVYQRVRILEDIQVGKEESFYEVIRLFQGKLEFTINLKTGNCSRTTLNRPWRDIGVFPDAKSYGEAYVGSSVSIDDGLLVTIWNGNETFSQNRTVNYLQAWSYAACLPIFDTSFDSRSGRSHSSFYDVVSGIKDPNVFIPPRQCLTEQEYAIRDTLFAIPPKKRID